MDIKEQVKELWKICFDDTEAFTDLYFTYKYNENVNIAIQNDDEVIAALQMLPYSMTLWGKEVPTSYISGACTHPDYRGKGVMKELLIQSFLRMIDEGILFSTLIPAQPWLFGYYAHMGYAAVFDYTTHTLPATGLKPAPPSISIQKSTTYTEEAYHYFNRKMKERSCCIQHTADDYKVILADLALSNGQVMTTHQQGKITGIAFAAPEEDTIIIKELFTEDRDAENQLFYEAARLYPNYKQLSVITPLPDKSDGNRSLLGMARIILAEPVLQMYATTFPETQMSIEVIDQQIPGNTGYYIIRNGKCVSSKMKKASITYQTMTISELTQMVLKPLRPYMSLMLD